MEEGGYELSGHSNMKISIKSYIFFRLLNYIKSYTNAIKRKNSTFQHKNLIGDLPVGHTHKHTHIPIP
jgi:hypothetical protein